jgi:phage shock protein E
MSKMVSLVVVIALLAAVVAYFIFSQRNNAVIGALQLISPSEYRTQYVQAGQPHLLLDVRTPAEFSGGHIPGAVNIALQNLPQRLAELPKDRPLVIYCRSGNRSRQAQQYLAQAGFTNTFDLGGIIAWQAQGLSVQ